MSRCRITLTGILALHFVHFVGYAALQLLGAALQRIQLVKSSRNAAGNAVNTIATVYWLNADISSYGATLVSNIYFLLCFWALFVAHAIIYRDWSILAPASVPEERRLLVWPRRRDAEGKRFWSFTQAQLCAIVGFFFAWMLLSFNVRVSHYCSRQSPPFVHTEADAADYLMHCCPLAVRCVRLQEASPPSRTPPLIQ